MFDLKQLQGMLVDNDFDGILLADMFNVSYAMGMFDRVHMELEDCPLLLVVPAKGEPFSLAGRHFCHLLGDTPFEKNMYTLLYNAKSYADIADILVRALKEHGLGSGRLGIERLRLPAMYALAMRDQLPELELADASWIMCQMRSVKCEKEVSLIRKAIDGSEAAWHRLLENVTVNSTRRELRKIIEQTASENDCEILPRSVLWRSQVPEEPDSPRKGLDASLILRQHWCGSVLDEPIESDKTFEMDLVFRHRGYFSDIYMRFCIGTPEDEVVETLIEHQRAQDELSKTIRPGMPAKVALKNLRGIVKDLVGDKYGPDPLCYIHGVGLEPHEEPFVNNEWPEESEQSRITMEVGTVFVIECEFGSVWYENMHLLTEDGVERMNKHSNMNDGPDIVPKR